YLKNFVAMVVPLRVARTDLVSQTFFHDALSLRHDVYQLLLLGGKADGAHLPEQAERS
ncbi:MAG: hypothetical protein RL341_1097, partial [Pseudomonadota bacterium]